MYGRICCWLMVGAAMVGFIPAGAYGQQGVWEPMPPEDSGYMLPPDNPYMGPAATTEVRSPEPIDTQTSMGAEFSGNLPARLIAADKPAAATAEERIKKLEEELKKLMDKEAAAQKKAAAAPSVKVNGRIFLDWAMFGQGAASRANYGDVQDGVAFRSARIGVAGEAFHVVDYKIEMDFADTDQGHNGKLIQSTSFKDVYLGVNELPLLGHVRVGHFKEPFSLEELISARYITFMERALPVAAFAPARKIGIMAYDTYWDERGVWSIGAFTSEMENDSEPPIWRDDDGGVAATMRLTFLPWYDEASDGRGLLHTGIAYSYRNIADGNARFRSRNECYLGPTIVDTGQITGVPEVQLLGIEGAWVYGPLSVQAEYFNVWVPRTGIGTAYLNGAYVYVSYFLTGEHRPYDRKRGVFDRVRPFTNFFRVRAADGVQTGWGAWELAYRYSWIDLVDLGVGVNGGVADDHTLGLNWYLNPYTRIMFNYVLAKSTDRYGIDPITDMSTFQIRAQIDF
ncbi:MAG: porin [Thermoguttaceae bacterium]|nr:porin [Thermoguttaceae bacterium]MDW8039783.1 porin [Thermoguttaceae bacterium]